MMRIFKIAQTKTLQLTPFMASEIAIDFEYYEEHYDDPNDPQMLEEKTIYEKLSSGNYNFTKDELILIGQTLGSIDTKDHFLQDNKNKRELFNVQLQLGMWNPITDEEVKSRIRNSLGVRMSHFPKVNGIRYDYNDNWQNTL